MGGRRATGTALVALIGIVSGCTIPNGVRDRTATAVTLAPPNGLPAPDLTHRDTPAEPDYFVGPLDTLAVSVFQVPDLSKTVQVDSSGHFAFPLIGRVNAQGLTADQISQEVAARLRRFIVAPDVTTLVQQAVSQKITVEGSVAQPGVYAIQSRTTLLQMIATARGVDQFADEKTIIIFRTIKGIKMAARFNLQAIRGGDTSDPEVFGNDVVVVTRSGPKTTFRLLLQALPVAGFFFRYIF